jgi:two-component system, sensor histidine kinase and response regulator
LVQNNEDVQEKLDMVYMGANHLAEMINSILEYSKQSFNEQKIEEVDTYELVNQVVFLLFPPKHIKIKIADDLPVLQTRKLKLQQVFQNLVSNAIKYIDKAEGLIEIGAKEKGDFYEFFVRDNGPGIESEDTARVFKLFQTTNNKTNTDSSTGVGLNILKVLVEEQGGKIWVESKVGEGSTFYFEWKK